MSAEPRPFNRRALVTMTIGVSGLGLPLTGLVLHALQLEPMGLGRHAWMTAHWSLGIIFLVFSISHAVLNRKVLLKYLRGMADRARPVSREFIGSLAVVGIIMFLAMAHAFHAN